MLAGLLACAVVSASGQPARYDTASLNRTPEVQEAFDHFYNLDYDGALSRFERVETAHPGDPLATDYVLYVVIFKELNRLDLLDTTFYANDGFLTGKHTVVEDPAVRDRVKAMSDKAVGEAEARLAKNTKDADALYARGWAKSLQATYLAMVERAFTGALHLALQARADHEGVLGEDPNYVDANLVVGVYEYVVGALPFSFRVVVGIAGIHGSREKGMAMLRVAAAHGITTSVEARTCMMLFLRREARYGEAVEIAHGLAQQYPHGFLFQLEEANLAKDAGQGMRAVGIYRDLLSRLGSDPGYFHSPHPELAYYGLGESLRGQKMYADAVNAYRSAAVSPKTSLELKRRSLLAAGESLDLAGRRGEALAAYQQVMDAGSDSAQASDAKKYTKKPYTAQ